MATDYDDPVVYRTTQKVEFPLRDYFAAAALRGLSINYRNATGVSKNILDAIELDARLAYLMADAMLKQREVRDA